MDPDAPITHWIFIDRADLERELKSVGIGKEKRALVSYSEAVKDECAKWLAEQFRDPAKVATTKATFERSAMQHFPRRLSHRGFLAAWHKATEEFPERRTAGRRPSR